MKRFTAAASFLMALTLAADASAQAFTDQALDLQLHPDGTVTLLAQNITAREIMADWARKCGCFVVNADRLRSTLISVPLVFDKVPQSTVLRSLLKEAGGYVLTPRRAGSNGPSSYETIYILPTNAAASAPLTAMPNPISFQPVQSPTAGAPDDEIPPVTAIRIPEPVDPSRPNPPTEPTGPAPAPNAPSPGVSVPGVRVVPITPTGPGTSPGSNPPSAPGGVTPARNP